ncbi:MAG: DNA polymerase III subunit delta [Lachnospiraceae bacterium]|nr:DNA polymerase III subunit delta [Lachnospiraceae bacterium]MBR6302393.1 DNA polymerase III subunit delta [Lachnospiraceae bacterium]MBR6908767.1 DNA polymerase III subunit delta [Lachnospiraceae bacterium]
MKARDAKSSFDQLKQHIRNKTLPGMVLLYGEERYLRLQYLTKVMDYYGGKKGDMNTDMYEGKNVNVGAVIDQAETLPFLAETRVMVFQDTGLFKSGGDQLADYLQSPCETSVFIFCENEVDERCRLYKTVKEKGAVAQIDEQTRETLQSVIGVFLKKEGKRISVETAGRILDKTGNDMAMLRSELEKLVSYCMDKDVIETEDVEIICSQNIEDKIFELIDAISEKNARKAMELYYDMLALKEPPIKLLVLMEKQFNQLLQIRLLRDEGEQRDTIATKVGINPYFISSYMNRASKYSAEELRRIFELAIETDEEIKTGKISDVLGVETLILSLL